MNRERWRRLGQVALMVSIFAIGVAGLVWAGHDDDEDDRPCLNPTPVTVLPTPVVVNPTPVNLPPPIVSIHESVKLGRGFRCKAPHVVDGTKLRFDCRGRGGLWVTVGPQEMPPEIIGAAPATP